MTMPSDNRPGTRLVILCIFTVSPLLGIAGAAMNAWHRRFTRSKRMFLLVILGAAYLSLINTTKVPDSDFANYLNLYAAAQDLNLPDYLALFSREPLYYLWVYLLSAITSGSAPAFTFFSSLVTYILILHNASRISKHFALSGQLTVSLVITFIFFGPLFSLSAHLMRQFFAAALVLTFYTGWLVTGRRPWWVLLSAVLMHYSAALFMVFAVMKLPRRLNPGALILLACAILGAIFVFAQETAKSMATLPLFGLIFSRIGSTEGHDLGHLSMPALVFVAIITMLALSNLRSQQSRQSQCRLNSNMSAILLAIIVIVANMDDGTVEISNRFYFYQYFLAAMVIPHYIAKAPGVSRGILIAAPLLASVHFFANIQLGAWQYANLVRVIFLPAWELWGR